MTSQPRGPPLPLDRLADLEARRAARARPAGVRDAARGGLRPGEAPRDGLRDDHRPRHDRRRPGDRRPARRVRLRGADRPLPGRAAGRPRALSTASRPTTTTGCRRTPATSRRSPSTCTSSEITCALAHPFYAVAAPLPPRHRRRLAELFPIWEVRNGSRAPRAQPPGGDLHRDPRRHRHRRLRRPRGGRHRPHVVGDAARGHARGVPRAHPRRPRRARAATRARPPSGRTPRWRWRCARSAAATATRRPTRRRAADGRARDDGGRRAQRRDRLRPRARGRPRPAARLARCGRPRAWTEAELLALLQSDGFSHAACAPRAPLPRAQAERRGRAASIGRPLGAGRRRPDLFEACVAAIPYAPAAAFLGREKDKLATREHEPLRVALVADGIGGMHGVTHTLDEIRERGVPGFEVEVIGTDPHVDRRLAAVDRGRDPVLPRACQVGVPGLPAVVEALAEGRYGVVHVCSPGPAGVAAALIGARARPADRRRLPHGAAAYAALRSGDPRLALAAEAALGAFYGGCDIVLSPSAASDARLAELGVDARARSGAGTAASTSPASPRHCATARPATARARPLRGPADEREGRRPARRRVPRGARARPAAATWCSPAAAPRRTRCATRLGGARAFLGWLEGDALARAYANADLFLFCSRTDTFGQVVLEAQASGLPVVAVDAGGPAELIARRPHRPALPARRRRTRRRGGGPRGRAARHARGWPAAAAAVRERTWDASLAALAAGWRRALAAHAAAEVRRGMTAALRGAAALAPAARDAADRCGSWTSPLLRPSLRRHPHLPRREGGLRAPDGRVRAPPDRARRARAADGRRVDRARVAVGERRDVQRLPLAARDARRWRRCCASSRPTWCSPTIRSGRRRPPRAPRGGRVVAVHHGSPALDAAGVPGPARVYRPLVARLMRRVDARSDAVDGRVGGRAAAALRPRSRVPAARRRARGDHVLYAGRLARGKGVDTLLEAAARGDWELRLIGAGTAARQDRGAGPAPGAGQARHLPRARRRPRRARPGLPRGALRGHAGPARDVRARRL